MTDRSANLDMPYLLPSQAQKHVTHNEALELLDVLVQLVVEAFDATIPPAQPAEGDVHALGAGAAGAWAGHDGALAGFSSGGWNFTEPRSGWRAWGQGDGTFRIWTGSAWEEPQPALDNLDGVGIGTSADAVNRLAVAADATLLSHDGAGHHLKINKAGPADAGSLLFQTGWSGRAEMGLIGADDFTIKVSADGSSWQTGLSIDAVTGDLTLPRGVALNGAIQAVGPINVGTTDTNPASNNVEGLRIQSDGQIRASNTGLAPLVLNRMEGAGQIATFKSSGTTVAYLRVDPGEVALVAAEGDLLLKAGGGTRIALVETGEVGIGTAAPQRQLHLDSILRLEPSSTPANPAAGDIYFDSATSKLRCHDGIGWHDLF